MKLGDTLNNISYIAFRPPSGLPGNSINTIKVRVISTSNSQYSDSTRIYIRIYQPTLSKIDISPDSSEIGQNKLKQFIVQGFDQFSKKIEIKPNWTATGGTIDSTGLFTAGSNLGNFSITAKDALTNFQDNIKIKIISSQSILKSIEIQSDTLVFFSGMKSQFHTSGKDQFDSTLNISVNWTASGGTIDTQGFYTAGNDTGVYIITAKEKTTNLVGLKTIYIVPNKITVKYPVNNSVISAKKILYSWCHYPGATRYQLQIARDSIFNSLIINDSAIYSSDKIIIGLDKRTLYHSRLRAIFKDSTTNWSRMISFSTSAGDLSKITILSPTVNSLIQLYYPVKKIIFSWKKPDGLEIQDSIFYNLFIEGTDFKKEYRSLIDTLFNADIMADLKPSKSFRWYINAQSGARLTHSDTGFFNTSATITKIFANEIPLKFSLDQNYPNPFNPATTIQYQLPKENTVKLLIYNVIGQLVRTLVNEKQQAGYYKITWDGKGQNGINVSSGVYFYKLSTNDFISIKKLNLIK